VAAIARSCSSADSEEVLRRLLGKGLSFEVLDVSQCSHSLLLKFIDNLQDECKLRHGGRLGYSDAISELIDFRKINGPSDRVLCLSSTELYLKRMRKTDEIAVNTRSRRWNSGF